MQISDFIHLNQAKNKRYYFFVAIVLALLVLVLLMLWQRFNFRHENNLHSAFILQTERVSTKISERMLGYGLILRSGAGLFAGSSSVKHEDWRRFVEKLDLERNQNYHGIQGVGFAVAVPKQKLDVHLKEIRKQGFPAYSIKPTVKRDIYTSVIYIEPFSGRNLRAFGYDMYTEVVRHEAMDRARDSGNVTFSGKVALVQETDIDVQVGLLAYSPVYQNGVITETVEERRAALIGWVYSPYRMKDLLTPIVEYELPAMRLEIFDGETITPEALLYDNLSGRVNSLVQNTQPLMSTVHKAEFGGRYWTLRYTALPDFALYSKLEQPWIEGVGIFIMGILLFVLGWAFVHVRRQADDLVEKEKMLNKSQEEAHLGTWKWNISNNKMFCSDEIYRIFRLNRQADVLTFESFLSFVHPSDKELVTQHIENSLNNNIAYNIIYRLKLPGEIIRFVSAQAEPESEKTGSPISMFGIIEDITERRLDEIRVERLRNFYATLSSINDVIIHSTDEQQLLNEICRISVENGHMEMAWVGIVDPENQLIVPQAKYGKGADYLDEMILDELALTTRTKWQEGQGITGKAWRDQKTVVNDCNSAVVSWDHQVKAYGWHSSASFPIFRNNYMYAVFTAYHTESQIFDEEIVLLLSSMVGDVTFALDNMDSKRALIESEAQSRLLLDSTSSGIWGGDRQGIAIFVNSSATAMLGYDEGELVGQPMHDTTHHSYQDGSRYPCEKCPIYATIEDGKPRLISDDVFWRKDGSSFPVEYNTHPIYQETVLIGAVVVFQDITARKKVEQDLLKLWLSVEQSPNWIFITNIYNEIEYVNKCFTKDTGYSLEEVEGKNPRLLQSGLTDPDTYRQMWAALTQGLNWSGGLVNRCKDGRHVAVWSRISPVRQADGNITHYLSIIEDITEKKRAGQELDNYRFRLEKLVIERTDELSVATKQAEAASRSKSAFLANMSHEIRTPMGAILGLTHLLQGDIDHPGHLDRLKKIESAGNHLLSIINDILDFSKIEANQLRLENIPLNITSIIDHVYSMMNDRAKFQQIKLIISIDPRLIDLPLSGDSFRIEQILINFISNAIKFTKQGSVTLRAHLESEQDESVNLRLEVQDTGIGLSKKNRVRLFEAFEQAETSTTRSHGGTGLGLAISKRLAELMGGAIGVESKLGKGSTFWLALRLRRGSSLILDDHPNLTYLFRVGVRILLVEDSLINQEVTKELLERVGLVVDVANQGAEAVERVEANTYDLILMDMQMPIMDGIEATRRIRKLDKGKTVPILALTANAFDEDRDRCLEAGMNSHLSKPILPSLLYTTLARWIPGTNNESQACPPAPDKVPDLIEEPIVNDVLDMQTGLLYFGGKLPSYRRTLLRFTELHSDSAAELIKLLVAGDRTTAEQLAHTLKGLSATLGGEKVRKIAADLEGNIKEGEGMDELILVADKLGEAITELGSAIQQLQIDITEPALIDTDPDYFRGLINELDEQLATGANDALAAWKKVGSLLTEAVGSEMVNPIEQRIKASDLSGAYTLLQAIFEEMPGLKAE